MGGPTQHFFKMELEAYLRPVFLRDFIVLVFLEDFLVAAAFLTRRAFAGLFELFLPVFCAFAASATVFVAFFMGLGVRLATAFFALVAPAFTAVSADVAAALAARSVIWSMMGLLSGCVWLSCLEGGEGGEDLPASRHLRALVQAAIYARGPRRDSLLCYSMTSVRRASIRTAGARARAVLRLIKRLN
jgi:hypothetical protein